MWNSLPRSILSHLKNFTFPMLRGANRHVIWLSASSLGKFGKLQKEVSQLGSISKLLESLLNSSFSFSISDCFPITFLHFHAILLTEKTLFLFIGKFDGFIRDYLSRGSWSIGEKLADYHQVSIILSTATLMHPDTRRRNYFPISVYAARANCLITLLLNVKQNALRGSYQGLSCIHSRCYANYRTSFGKLTLVCKPSQPLFIPWLLLHVCSAILIRSSL